MNKLRALNLFGGSLISESYTWIINYLPNPLSTQILVQTMKIFNVVFCILFILFAAVQYNDPDPYIWIPIYLYAAVLCWLAFRNKYFPSAYLLGIVAYAGYAI
jgi:hypothetical protein